MLIKIFKLSSKTEKINFFLFIFSSIVTSILDLLSIGLLIPLIKIVVSGLEELNFYFLGKDWSINLGIILILLIFFSIVKSTLIIITTRFQISTIWNFQSRLRKNALMNYINFEFQKLISEHSSVLLRNINHEVSNFVQGYLIPVFGIISNIFLICILSGLVIVVNYQLSLTLLVCFIILFFIIKKLLNPKLKDFGYQRQQNQTDLLRLLTNLFNFVKEIKFYNLQEYFIQKLDENNTRGKKLNRTRGTLSVFPRIMTEIIFISIFCYLIFSYQDNETFLITIGVYAAVTIRILPSINSFLSAYQKIKNSKATFSIVLENLTVKEKSIEENIKLEKVKEINIKDLNFKYKNSNDYNIQDLNLKILENDKICIYGESGAGKSTFINLILGFLKPENINSIKSSGTSIFKNLKSWRNKISYVPQNIVILDEDIKTNIIFSSFEKNFDESKYQNCIKMTSLSSLVEKMSQKNNQRLGESGSHISPGEKQKIGISRALYRDADILILDEISNHLDRESKLSIMQNIMKIYKDKIIISISHDKDLIDFFDKKYLFKNNRLINA